MNNNIISTKEAVAIIKSTLGVTKAAYSKSPRKGGMFFHAIKVPNTGNALDLIDQLVLEDKTPGWVRFNSQDFATVGLKRLSDEVEVLSVKSEAPAEVVETVEVPAAEVATEPVETFTMEEVAGAEEVTTGDDMGSFPEVIEGDLPAPTETSEPIVETKKERKARLKREREAAEALNAGIEVGS